MNWLDVVLGLVLIVSTFSGLAKGMARMVIGFAATVIGLVGGLLFYGEAGDFIKGWVSSEAIANLLGFFVIFFGCLVIGALMAKAAALLFKWVGIGWLDRLIGGGIGFVRGMLVSAVIVMLLVAFSVKPPPGSVANSFLAPYVIEFSGFLARLAPRGLHDSFFQSYDKIREVWGQPAKPQHPEKKTY